MSAKAVILTGVAVYSQRLVNWKVTGSAPLVWSQSVLGQDTEPQTTSDVQVSTLHGCPCHQCINVCMNYCKSLWTKKALKWKCGLTYICFLLSQLAEKHKGSLCMGYNFKSCQRDNAGNAAANGSNERRKISITVRASPVQILVYEGILSHIHTNTSS